MKLDKLTGAIFFEACRYFQLKDQEHLHKWNVIKQAIINIVIHRNSNTVSFSPDNTITLKFQRISKTIEQDDMLYIRVEYGYQNIRIFNVRLNETITLSELSILLKQK